MNHFKFSAIFTSRRKELGATQEQIAEYIGVSRAAVSKWEKGQSYPDITLLPKLATYFNISIDTLLGYEPQLTEERIIELYGQLASRFSTEPYETVVEEIERLLNEYYSCFPFVLKMAQLYLNYLSKSPEPQQSAERVIQLCQRVREWSDEYSLQTEARMLETSALLVQGKAAEVIEELGEHAIIQYGADQVIAMAHLMLGHTDKAKEIMQASVFQHVVLAVGISTESLLLEVQEPDYFEQMVQRVEQLIQLFQIEELSANPVLIFYLKAAEGYMLQMKEELALQYIEKYARLCKQLEFPFKVKGNDYFYLLDAWFKKDMQLASVTPRDDESIKRDLVTTVTQNKAFAKLETNKKFQAIKVNLTHYLLKGGYSNGID